MQRTKRTDLRSLLRYLRCCDNFLPFLRQEKDPGPEGPLTWKHSHHRPVIGKVYPIG